MGPHEGPGTVEKEVSRIGITSKTVESAALSHRLAKQWPPFETSA